MQFKKNTLLSELPPVVSLMERLDFRMKMPKYRFKNSLLNHFAANNVNSRLLLKNYEKTVLGRFYYSKTTC